MQMNGITKPAWLAGVLTVMILLTGVLPATGSTDATINWVSYDAARNESEKNGKKYFVYFSSKNCGYCRMLESKTFLDSSVVDYINTNFIPVLVKAEKNQKIVMQYKVRGFPDLQFLSDKGAVIGRWMGFIEADHLLNLLKFIKTDSYLNMSFRAFIDQQ